MLSTPALDSHTSAPAPLLAPLGDDQSIADLDELIARVAAINAATADLSDEALNALSWSTFIRRMRLLSPQAWSTRVEKRLLAAHHWKKLPASLACGDAATPSGNFEVKATVLTDANSRANFVQIRPHHDVAGYHLFVVEADNHLVHLTLTKEQMAKELDLCGGLAHGTKKQKAHLDAHAEFAIRFDWIDNNPTRERFRAYEVPATERCCDAE